MFLVRLLWVAILLGSLLGVYSKLPLYALVLQAGILLTTIFTLVVTPGTALAATLGPVRALVWAAILFVAFATTSAIGSVAPADSVLQVGQWVSYLGLALVSAVAFDHWQVRRWGMDFVFLVGILMCGLAIYFYWGEVGNLPLAVMVGIFGNKNHLAGFLLLLILPALCLLVSAHRTREVIAYGGCSLLFGAILVLTYSRGAYIALLPALALCLWSLRREGTRRLAFRLGPLALLLIAQISLIRGASFGYALGRGSEAAASVAQAALGAEAQGTLAPRLEYWRAALGIMRDNTGLGTGLGTYHLVFPEHQQDPRFYSKFAHNFPLQTGAEMGLPGLAAALGLLGALAFYGLRAMARARGTGEYGLAVGLAAALLASILHNLVELDWYIPAIGNLFWAEVGLLLGLLRAEPFVSHQPRPWRVGAIVLCCLALGAILSQLASQSLLEHGANLRRQQQAEAAEVVYLWATRLNPLGAEAYFELADMYLERFEAGDVEEDLHRGIALATEATGRSPRNVAYRSLLARFYLLGASSSPPLLGQAVAELEAMVARRPSFALPYGYLRLGDAYLALGEEGKAAATFQKLLAGFPQGVASPQSQFEALPPQELAGLLAQAHLALGKLAYADGDIVAAVAEFQEAAALEPHRAEAPFNLGSLYLHEGQDEKAVPYLERAVALAPSHLQSRLVLAAAYIQLGQREDARASLEAALAIDPGNETVRRQLEALKAR